MRWLAAALVFAACATTPVATPAGGVTARDPEGLPGESKELASAWDRPEPEAMEKKVLLPPLPPPVDRAEGFKAALAAGNAALGGKRLDEARGSAATACAEAEKLDGESRSRAHHLAFKVEVAAKDGAAAAEASRACSALPAS